MVCLWRYKQLFSILLIHIRKGKTLADIFGGSHQCVNLIINPGKKRQTNYWLRRVLGPHLLNFHLEKIYWMTTIHDDNHRQSKVNRDLKHFQHIVVQYLLALYNKILPFSIIFIRISSSYGISYLVNYFYQDFIVIWHLISRQLIVQKIKRQILSRTFYDGILY